jgi:hypothetical protein
MKDKGILLNPDTFEFDIKVVREEKEEGKITQGLHVGDVTQQNTAIILYMHPGELKEHPTVGVGINNMLLDKNFLLYKHRIRQQLNAEGMQVNHLEINKQNIEINATYK